MISFVLVFVFISVPVVSSSAKTALGSSKRTNIEPSVPMCSMTDYTVTAMPGLKYGEQIQELLDMYFGNEKVFPKNGAKCSRKNADAVLDEFRSAYAYCQTTAVYYFGNDAYLVSQDTNENGYTASVFSWADSVICRLGIGKTTSQYDAVIMISNYLCDYLHYDYGFGSCSIWEGICSGEGTCTVYTVLFQILCQKCGIICMTYHPQKNHIRNYVLINGERFNVDVTWNDPLITLNGVSAEVEDRQDLTAEQKNGYRLKYCMF